MAMVQQPLFPFCNPQREVWDKLPTQASRTPVIHRRVYEAGTAIKFCDVCEECGSGRMTKVVQLSREERINMRCGKLLLVRCSNQSCGNERFAYRDKKETAKER